MFLAYVLNFNYIIYKLGDFFKAIVLLKNRKNIVGLSGGKDISSQASENAQQMKIWSDEYKKSK